MRAPIGRVEVCGPATVLRNGVSVDLRVGDVVTKGDVVQTGSASVTHDQVQRWNSLQPVVQCRMVLNDMVYAADSSSNSALLHSGSGRHRVQLQGGSQKPVISGSTLPWPPWRSGERPSTPRSRRERRDRFSLLTEPDGTVGSFVLLDRTNPSRVHRVDTDPRDLDASDTFSGHRPRITQVTKQATRSGREAISVRDLFPGIFARTSEAGKQRSQ